MPSPSARTLTQVLPLPVRFDAGSQSAYGASVSSLSWTHTCSTDTNRCLVVAIALLASGTVSSITYNGVALTKVRSDATGVTRSELWVLAAPATGANTVAVTLSGLTTAIGAAASYTGVDQVSPAEASAGATGTGGTPTASPTTATGHSWVLSGIATTNASPTAAAPATVRGMASGALGSVAIEDTTGSVAQGSTASAWAAVGVTDSWAVSAVSLQGVEPDDTVSAACSGAATVTCALVRLRAFSPASAGVATASAAVVATRALAASATGVATISCAIVRLRALSPASVGAGASSATIVATRVVAAASAGTAIVTAGVVRMRTVAAASTGVATVTATVGKSRFIVPGGGGMPGSLGQAYVTCAVSRLRVPAAASIGFATVSIPLTLVSPHGFAPAILLSPNDGAFAPSGHARFLELRPVRRKQRLVWAASASTVSTGF